ncbi:MAG: hypothetical protein KF693_02100 [Nitrospira sp.]|nr:hypothetical protein [Nitrospira sp.]
MIVNWKADSGDRRTVPVGVGLGKGSKIGSQPMNASAQVYYNAVKTDVMSATDW